MRKLNSAISLNRTMEKIHFVQDYKAPLKNVFSFYSDHNRWSEIMPAVIRRIVDSPNPSNCNDAGSQRIIISLGGIFAETITKYIENKQIDYAITFGSPLKNHKGTMKFIELSPTSCRLDYTIVFEPKIPKTGFILRNILEKQVGNGIRELARKFEKNPNF